MHTIEEIEKISKAAIDSWFEKMGGPKGIERHVHGLLNRRIEEIVSVMIGLSKRNFGGGWEIDHCNGRMSEVSNWIKTRASVAIEDFFKDVSSANFPKVSDDLLEEFQKNFDRELRHELDKKLRASIEERANQIVEKCLNPNASETQEKKDHANAMGLLHVRCQGHGAARLPWMQT